MGWKRAFWGKVGEEIQILGYTDDPKWAMGRNASGRKGLVPVGHFDKAAGAAQDSMQGCQTIFHSHHFKNV